MVPLKPHRRNGRFGWSHKVHTPTLTPPPKQRTLIGSFGEVCGFAGGLLRDNTHILSVKFTIRLSEVS